MTAPSIASATVVVTPTLDISTLDAELRATVAASLRKLADELHVEKDAPAPRYRVMRDAEDDYAVHDTVDDRYTDLYAHRARAFELADKLNAGGTAHERTWTSAENGYPPYVEVTR
ncbi:hypothetical protein SEA_MABODAMACA_28 [Microbacterium phage Mabodamaca]|uniref:Uncharacterized protein n=1 Tax=Microbacterium phage Mabodamaca TaxID=3078574 RepID=A0AA96NGT1_9CAUD|nr:hypothetical protein SEA_MABODAMACA_28 [Microbacterium phage Mabodamaca]